MSPPQGGPTAAYPPPPGTMIQELQACPMGSYDRQSEILERYGELNRPSSAINLPDRAFLLWGGKLNHDVLRVLLDLLDSLDIVGDRCEPHLSVPVVRRESQYY